MYLGDPKPGEPPLTRNQKTARRKARSKAKRAEKTRQHALKTQGVVIERRRTASELDSALYRDIGRHFRRDYAERKLLTMNKSNATVAFDKAIKEIIEIAEELPTSGAVELHTKADLLKVAASLVGESA